MRTLDNIRSANRLLILFFISYNLFLSSSEMLQSPQTEVLQSPQYFPEKSLKELSVPIREAYEYSDEVKPDQLPLCPEQLVLAADQTAYNYAIVFPLTHDKTIYLKVFKKDTTEPYPIDKIRILKLLPQILLQPHLPRRMLMLYFRKIYAEKFEDQMPFIQSKILESTNKIMVIGDLNGDFEILRQILFDLHSKQCINKEGTLSPNTIMVFTGNLTGQHSDGPEIWHLINTLKELNKKQVFLLRGVQEILDFAIKGSFFEQMMASTKLPPECIAKILYKLFNNIAYGLFLGKAPDKRQDPYHFLIFCHGGFDPLVTYQYYLNKIVKKDKRAGSVEPTSFILSHSYPQYSDLLWTDFIPNRCIDEGPHIKPSTLGLGCIINKSGAELLFGKLQSISRHHHYTVDALFRGNQLQTGISELKSYSPASIKENDWRTLLYEIKEKIKPSSIYSCSASTKRLLPSQSDPYTYAEIIFEKETQSWYITAHSTPHKKHLQCI